ncbi:MAG: ATP-binding protein [Ilumatobacteraceae bacterium]
MQIQSTEVEHIISTSFQATDANEKVFRDVTEAQNSLLRYQLSGDRDELTTFRNARTQIRPAQEQLHSHLTRLTNREDISSEKLVIQLESNQQDTIRLWLASALKSERAALNSELPNFTQSARLFEDFRQANSRLDELFGYESIEARNRARAASSTGIKVILIAAFASTVIMLVFGLRIARSISRPITALSGTIKHQREGDLSVRARENFGSAEVRSLATDFNLLAEANLKSRLRIEDVNDRMANLIDLGNVLGEKLGLHELLTRIVESARQLIGARYVAIALLDESGKEVVEFVTAGFSPDQVAAIGDLPKGLGLLGVTFHDTQIIRLEHISASPLSVGFPPNHPPMESFLGVPIVIDGTVIGSFYLTDSISGTFSAEDEQVAHSLSLVAAVAIRNVQRLETERVRANTLERVNEIELVIHAKSISERPFDVMSASLGKGLGVDRVFVRTVDSGGEYQLASQWQRDGLQPIGNEMVAAFPSVGDLAEDLWKSASVRIIDDHMSASGPIDERSRSHQRITGARAAIIAPIGIGDRVIGIVSVLMVDGPRHWTAPEAEVLKRVANYVATTIINDEHVEIQRNHITKLEQLERQKSNFLATVSHELRTPLTSIIGYLELLQEGYAGTISDEQKHMLEVMNRNSDRLQALIENLLVISRIEGSEVAITRSGIFICDLIATTCEEFLPLAKSRGISFEVNPGPNTAIVKGDERQLRSVIANVVSNAIKFSHIGGLVKISCAVDSATQTVEVTCIDVGIGIPLADQGNLFVRFFRAGNAVEKQIPGTGLGLSIVELIVREHGGHIRLASTEGEGTTVVIDFPLSTQDSF